MAVKPWRQETQPRRGRWRLALLAAALVVLASCGGGDGGNPPLRIQTLSNRADLVSGGDAVVGIAVPPGSSNLKVTLNGSDVTSAFGREGGGRVTGRVTGLRDGTNTLKATADGADGAQLVITNHPLQGPVLSGAQVTPYYCATPAPQAGSGNTPNTNPSGLAGQPDAGCNIPAETKLYYRTTVAVRSAANPGGCDPGLPDPYVNPPAAGALPAQPTPPANACWKPYTRGSTPADMARTTTDAGVRMPFIVQVERGTINRGIYDIAVLVDPARDWTPTQPQAGWNRKVYYNFGFSTGQPRRQSRPTLNWSTQEAALGRGFMYVGNSMTDSSRNSNRVLMAETVMMMKEHIGDTYGGVLYTMGTGCSGGSINANETLSIMPGLLDGVVTSCTYPDSETTGIEVSDCTLLVEAYQKPQMLNLWGGLTQAQINAKKAAINGHPDQSACHAWYNAFGNNGRAGLYAERFVVNNDTGALFSTGRIINNCELPNSAVYDPANPAATASLPRCDAWSWGASVWGTRAGSNVPLDTRDNVGVQYGLRALRNGTITPEEFVTLNEVVGGLDHDATPVAQRSTADRDALAIAYRAGIVADGAHLSKAAIIDLRGWDDSNITTPPGVTPGTNPIPIHHQWYSWAIRDRIVRDAGDARNQALWRFARNGLLPSPQLSLDAFLAMDQWLTTLVTAPLEGSIDWRVRVSRPASARSFCLLSSDATQSNRVYDMERCDQDPFLQPSLSPRQVAGGPRTEDVLKCQLKPLARSDYPAGTFTAGQWNRLQAVFPDGVCDFARPGVAQQPAQSPLTFDQGPGGQPLPPAPRSATL